MHSSPPEIQVKVFGLLGLAAARQGLGGGWRLWTLLRGQAQRGMVDSIRLPIPRRQRSRWRAEALRSGLLERWGRRYRVASIFRAARILGADCGHPASIPAALLLARDWRSAAWGAFLAGNVRGPISQDTLARWTGIPPRTQRTLRAFTIARRQHAVWTCPKKPKGTTARAWSAAWAGYWREFHPGAFVFAGKGRPRVAWPVPNVYSPAAGISPARRGASRRVRRYLADLLPTWRPEIAGRLFYGTPRAARKAADRLDVHEVYHRHASRPNRWLADVVRDKSCR